VPNALPQQRARARPDGGSLHSGLAARNHGADPRLASLAGHQCAQQRLAVDRIGLGAPVASKHSNRRRIDDVALNAVGLEQAVNPETIEADFLIATTLTGAAVRCSALLFNRARRSSSLRASPTKSVCFERISGRAYHVWGMDDAGILFRSEPGAVELRRLARRESGRVCQRVLMIATRRPGAEKPRGSY
jgi:hypothetical protein